MENRNDLWSSYQPKYTWNNVTQSKGNRVSDNSPFTPSTTLRSTLLIIMILCTQDNSFTQNVSIAC